MAIILQNISVSNQYDVYLTQCYMSIISQFFKKLSLTGPSRNHFCDEGEIILIQSNWEKEQPSIEEKQDLGALNTNFKSLHVYLL